MKIAIPTEDGVHIASHFGRCRQFLVFEVADGGVAAAEPRSNQGCGHAPGSHDHTVPHSHQGIMDTLQGCQMVFCAGIGAGAVEALRANGIEVVFVEPSGTAEEMVAAYQAGTLRTSSASACQCHHS
jgi:predicted Fe-Mo cluster-binding NifX family protein